MAGNYTGEASQHLGALYFWDTSSADNSLSDLTAIQGKDLTMVRVTVNKQFSTLIFIAT